MFKRMPSALTSHLGAKAVLVGCGRRSSVILSHKTAMRVRGSRPRPWWVLAMLCLAGCSDSERATGATTVDEAGASGMAGNGAAGGHNMGGDGGGGLSAAGKGGRGRADGGTAGESGRAGAGAMAGTSSGGTSGGGGSGAMPHSGGTAGNAGASGGATGGGGATGAGGGNPVVCPSSVPSNGAACVGKGLCTYGSSPGCRSAWECFVGTWTQVAGFSCVGPSLDMCPADTSFAGECMFSQECVYEGGISCYCAPRCSGVRTPPYFTCGAPVSAGCRSGTHDAGSPCPEVGLVCEPFCCGARATCTPEGWTVENVPCPV